LDQHYQQLIKFLLPKGLLNYFDLIKTTQSPNGLHIYLEGKIDLPVVVLEKFFATAPVKSRLLKSWFYGTMM
jgi:hypothetical protein